MNRPSLRKLLELALVVVTTAVFTSAGWGLYYSSSEVPFNVRVIMPQTAALSGTTPPECTRYVASCESRVQKLEERVAVLTGSIAVKATDPVDAQLESSRHLSTRPSGLETAAVGVDEVANKSLISRKRFVYVVLTSSANHNTRVKALMNTWGRHANIAFIASDDVLPTLPLVRRYPHKGKGQLGKKAMRMLADLCDDPNNSDADFSVMVDDDTFVITHNLEGYFSTLDPAQDLYAGYALPHIKPPIIGGGGGIVLSRGTMQKLCAKRKVRGSACNPASGQPEAGDAAVLSCMWELGIPATHVVGFNPFPVEEVATPAPNWCTITWWFPQKLIPCPPFGPSMTYHYISVNAFYAYYYWAYNFTHTMKPFPRGPSPYLDGK